MTLSTNQVKKVQVTPASGIFSFYFFVGEGKGQLFWCMYTKSLVNATIGSGKKSC